MAATTSRSVRQLAMQPLLDAAGALHPGRAVNVSTVPQRSPLRYPGGKTWLVPYIRAWLGSLDPRPRELVEPFAGGGIVSLTAVFEDLVDRAMMVELDDDVAAFWETVINGDGQALADDVASFRMSLESVRAVLARPCQSQRERAFAVLLRNRVQRGGILAPGASLMKNGENGKGISSRWYPETLARRTRDIVALRHRITFVHGDGMAVLQLNAHRRDAVYFIDPPYTVAGRRLYAHHDVDHGGLFDLATMLQGAFLMTYDSTEEIQRLARDHGFATLQVPMTNTHNVTKTELLIGRDLNWARTAPPT